MNTTDEIIVRAIRAALSGEGYMTITEEELAKVIKKAKNHGIGALVCCGLEACGLSSAETASVISAEIRRHILFDKERMRMEKVLSDNGVDYMLLKGSVIQDIYPEAHMRHMSDTDILIRLEERERVRGIMKAEGYSVEIYGRNEEDVYYKDPVYDYEIHIALFDDRIGTDWYRIYENVWDRLIPDCEGSRRYHFDERDMYVYLMAHAMKHYSNIGTGIKTLVDIYMIEKHYGLLYDSYVQKELKILGLDKLVPTFVSSVNKLFTAEEPSFTEDEQKILDKVFSSSQYGTRAEWIEVNLSGRGTHEITLKDKAKYIAGRIFPPADALNTKYPVLKKHLWLYPAVIVFRLIRLPFEGTGKTVRELKSLKKMK